MFVFPMPVIGVVIDKDDDDTPVLHHVRRSRTKQAEKWERETGGRANGEKETNEEAR